ncbi:RNA polymerase sigma factor [Streptomyces sp. NBC_00258]|uniref:RNA polymerase sigma factor n=1 Tax=Streptomyces sp. NBC_00258 TaxID=2903642 RepID=UPI002E2C1CA3|nr:RNA polymerase sigma factor [Streptomyces sp. NBC_00258]
MGQAADDWNTFEAIYRSTYVPVLRFLRRRVAWDDAEDAAAEVFATAWRRRQDLKGEPRPWLYGIARHVAANTLRSSGRAARLSDRLRDCSAEGDIRAAEDEVLGRLGAVDALAQLSPDDRDALMLVSWDGLQASDAAKAMGRSRGAFAVQLHRARRRLERAMTEEGLNPDELSSLALEGRAG